MKKTIVLSRELVEKVTPIVVASRTKKGVLDQMVQNGIDMTTDRGLAFIEDVVEAQAAYSLAYQDVVEEARTKGYPEDSTDLTFNHTSGLAWWEVPDEPEGEPEKEG